MRRRAQEPRRSRRRSLPRSTDSPAKATSTSGPPRRSGRDRRADVRNDPQPFGDTPSEGLEKPVNKGLMLSFIDHLYPGRVHGFEPRLRQPPASQALSCPSSGADPAGPEAMIPCTVKDISTGGARIELKPQMDLPETFELFIAAHDLQVRRARVCWRKDGYRRHRLQPRRDGGRAGAGGARALAVRGCLEQAAMPAHLAAAPARKRLKIYQTA